MRDWEPAPYRNCKWIVSDPDLLGGKLAVRGTRLSVSFVLACLAEGMSAEEIAQTYGPFPQEAIPEIMKVASELLDSEPTNTEASTTFAEPLLAWTFSTSFPLGMALLVYLRLHFGHNWPFLPARFGLGLLCIGLITLFFDIFLPKLVHGNSQVLRRQSIYSSIWTSLVGIWLYSKLWGDLGLVILIAVAMSLWPLSHREVLRLKGR